MKISKVGKRYARSLFTLSEENKTTEKIYKNLSAIGQLIEKSDEFASFLANPVVTIQDKKNIIKSVFEKKVNKETLTFLLFVTEKEKLSHLNDVCYSYENLYLESKKILKVRIISKIQMTKNQISKICQKLNKYYKKEIEPLFEIDSNLLGGFKVEVGDRIYDMTIAAQMDKFRKSVMNA